MLTSTVISNIDSIYPLYENGTLPVVHFPKALNTCVTTRKKIKQTEIVGYFAKYLTSTSQGFKGIKNRKSLRNCHHQEEPKET